MKRTFWISAALAAALSAGSPASAQGIPVFDASSIANQLQQITTMGQQLEQLKQQYEQAQQLYGSLNKLTDISSLASVLNDPSIRQALPQEFSQIEGLLKGNGSGIFQEFSQHHQGENSYYESSSNSFYAQELARNSKQTAGAQSLGQSMYEAASKRMAGLEQLKQRLSTAQDQKEVLDLQARVQTESAYLQTDMLRMQALAMVQKAQADVTAQRRAENDQKLIDQFRAAVR
jgi:type IV secretion system protein VirB5